MTSILNNEKGKGLLKKAKSRVRLYNIPVLPDNYFVELQDASDAIKEIQRELNKKTKKTMNLNLDDALKPFLYIFFFKKECC